MDRNFITEQEGINLNALIEAIVKRSCIIDFGTVLDNSKKGIVKVAVSVARTAQDMNIITCVLANIASSSLTVNVKPNVGDKVLVFYPRLYDNKMFDVPSTEADKKKVIVNASANGYNFTSGIAVLLSQFKTAGHKNLIDFDDGKLTLHIAYDKQNDKNLITLSTNEKGEINFDANGNTLSLDKDGAVSVGLVYSANDEKNLVIFSVDKDGAISVNSNDKYTFSVDKDGAISVNSNDNYTYTVDKDGNIKLTNPKCEIKVDKDGYLSYKNTSDSNTKLEFTSSSMTIQDNNGCKIVSSSSDIKINGKLTIKK